MLKILKNKLLAKILISKNNVKLEFSGGKKVN